jgi:hypothetical protein
MCNDIACIAPPCICPYQARNAQDGEIPKNWMGSEYHDNVWKNRPEGTIKSGSRAHSAFMEKQNPIYLGMLSGKEAGLVRIASHEYEVSIGTKVEGWVVEKITKRHITMAHAYDQAEKDEMWETGNGGWGGVAIIFPCSGHQTPDGYLDTSFYSR